MYKTWTISDQIVFLFEQFFCYLVAGTLLYDLYCRCLNEFKVSNKKTLFSYFHHEPNG